MFLFFALFFVLFSFILFIGYWIDYCSVKKFEKELDSKYWEHK